MQGQEKKKVVGKNDGKKKTKTEDGTDLRKRHREGDTQRVRNAISWEAKTRSNPKKKKKEKIRRERGPQIRKSSGAQKKKCAGGKKQRGGKAKQQQPGQKCHRQMAENCAST